LNFCLLNSLVTYFNTSKSSSIMQTAPIGHLFRRQEKWSLNIKHLTQNQRSAKPKALGIDHTNKLHLFKLPYVQSVLRDFIFIQCHACYFWSQYFKLTLNVNKNHYLVFTCENVLKKIIRKNRYVFYTSTFVASNDGLRFVFIW
jgi:hypothetical protein